MQEAITLPAPAAAPETLALPAKVVLVAPETPTETGFDELQVRGMPSRDCPMLSTAVACRAVEVPVFTTNEVPGEFVALI